MRVSQFGNSGLQVFDEELATLAGDSNFICFVRALYIAYRASSKQAIGSSESSKIICELIKADCS